MMEHTEGIHRYVFVIQEPIVVTLVLPTPSDKYIEPLPANDRIPHEAAILAAEMERRHIVMITGFKRIPKKRNRASPDLPCALGADGAIIRTTSHSAVDKMTPKHQ
jgi:hypothetical protein